MLLIGNISVGTVNRTLMLVALLTSAVYTHEGTIPSMWVYENHSRWSYAPLTQQYIAVFCGSNYALKSKNFFHK